MLKIIIFIFFSFQSLFSMEEEIEKRKINTFEDLNKLYQKEFVPRLKDAMDHRINRIKKNKNNDKIKAQERLFFKEAEMETEAYTELFDIDKNFYKKKKIKDIWEKIEKTGSDYLNIIREKLNLKKDFDDLTYHHYHIKTSSISDLMNTTLITDAHSSKDLFLIDQMVFGGDISDRWLAHPQDTSNQRKNKTVKVVTTSTIFEEEEEKEGEGEEGREKDSFYDRFYLVKHFSFFFATMIEAANTRMLINNNEKQMLKNIRKIYILGNHDVEEMVYKDIFQKIKNTDGIMIQNMRKFCSEIGKFMRQIVPAEVAISYQQEQKNKLWICNHSGGAVCFNDELKIETKKHIDFEARKITYKVNSNSIKDNLNKLLMGLQPTDLQETLEYIITTIIIAKRKNTNPAMWCDVFTNEIAIAKEKKDFPGRIMLNHINKGRILKIFRRIFMHNYEIDNIDELNIFRGHEHATEKLKLFGSMRDEEKYLSHKTCQNCGGGKVINFNHLPPCYIDNEYKEYFDNTLEQKHPTFKNILKNELDEIIEEEEKEKELLPLKHFDIMEELFSNKKNFVIAKNLVSIINTVKEVFKPEDENIPSVIKSNDLIPADEKIITNIINSWKNINLWPIKNHIAEGINKSDQNCVNYLKHKQFFKEVMNHITTLDDLETIENTANEALKFFDINPADLDSLKLKPNLFLTRIIIKMLKIICSANIFIIILLLYLKIDNIMIYVGFELFIIETFYLVLPKLNEYYQNPFADIKN